MTEYQQLYKILQEKKVAIYGAGYVAKRFFECLREQNLCSNIECFVTSEGQTQLLYGRPIISLDILDFDVNRVILIAVHESIKQNIIDALVCHGQTKYIWIYPLLNSIMLGPPLFTSIEVPIERLISTMMDDYRIAVRYLPIEEYYGINDYGYSIYKKVISIHSSSETAEKRLNQFLEVIEKWDRYGYDPSKSIDILCNDEVIDGHHRLALAIYHGYKRINCNIYENKKSLLEIHGSNGLQTKKSLIEAGISQLEMKLLDTKHYEIMSNRGLINDKNK